MPYSPGINLTQRAKHRADCVHKHVLHRLENKEVVECTSISEWAEDRVFEIFWLVRQASILEESSTDSVYQRWFTYAAWRHWGQHMFCCFTGQEHSLTESLLAREGADRASYPVVRGEPAPPSTTRYYLGVTVLVGVGAMGLGVMAAILYYGPSAAAAMLISQYPRLSKLGIFLRANITYMGPVANGLLTTEFIIRLSRDFTHRHTMAERQVKGSRTKSCCTSTVQAVFAVGPLIPVTFMSMQGAKTSQKIVSGIGAAAGFPGALVGINAAYTFFSRYWESRRKSTEDRAMLSFQKLFVFYLGCELETFIALPREAGHSHSRQIASLIKLLWGDNVEEVGYNRRLKDILPRLMSISNTTETISRYDITTNPAAWGFTAFLSILRILSLFGFTLESWRAGKTLAQGNEIASNVVGAFTSILTVISAGGLGMITIPKIVESTKSALVSIKNGTPFAGEAQYQGVAYFLAFFAALYIGFFSSGTGVLASEETLKGFGDEGSAVFQVISYVTTGCVINAVFILQLLKRVLSYYARNYANVKTKTFATFVSGYHRIIEMFEAMSGEQFSAFIEDENVAPVMHEFSTIYGVGLRESEA